MMTRRERVINAFNNKPVDRVPVSFWFHFLENESTIDGIANPEIIEKLFEGQKAFIEDFKPDFVKVMCDGLFLYPGENLQGIKNATDLDRIQPLDKDDPWIQTHIKYVKRVVEVDPDSCYFYNIFSPSMLFRILVGHEVYLDLFKENPQALKEALLRMGEGLAIMTKAVIEDSKADGIYYCVQNHNIEQISDDDYREIFTPSDLLVLDAANEVSTTGNLLHICGYEKLRNRVEFFADYDVKAVNWAANVEDVSMSEGKEIFGGRAVVGGFPNTIDGILNTGSKKEIQDLTEKLVEDIGKTGFIVGADCSLPFHIDVQNLKWVKEKLIELN